MRGVLRISLIYFILVIVGVNCDDVIVAINDDVTVAPNEAGTIYTVSMNENNHDFDAGDQVLVPLFKIVDANVVPTVSFVSTSFQYSVLENEEEASSYIFYATQSFDYETQPSQYLFNVWLNLDFSPVVNFTIINIDDEQPSLSPPQCSFDENTIYTKDNSTCFSIVSDPDGWLDQMTFEIVNDTNDAPYLFDFEYREIPEDNIYSANVYITVLEELNYQNITFYLFDVRAEDGAGHSTTPSELVRAIINVNDLPDTPPEWTSFFTSEQFYEQSEQTFTVTAIDGDYGLNYEINYMVLWEDDEEANYISIDNNGTISVKPIDRDKDDISTYVFGIVAYEVPDPIWNTSLTITFFVLDIDNNPPLVRWIMDASFDNVTFPVDDDTEKSTEMRFLENTDGTLNLTIFIRDIDTGENAQFSVELEDLEENEITYTDAFMIVPTAGYRTGQFQITVRNVTYIDYELPGWIDISFNVLTRGVLDSTKEDRILVKITLIDYNDETPEFEETEYSVSINETAKKGEFIIQILATDLDAEDKILEHSLIASTHASQILEIESDTGNIYVSADNAFDYDTVNPIFVQVRATDKVGHTATVPLTINLIDVNNKAPTISVGDPINVDENQQPGTALNSSITASDMDTTAELSAEIDWDASYVMKNSRRLDMDNETISQQVKFLDVEYRRVDESDDTNRDIAIDLIVNENNPNGTTPDFELFDSLFISLKVTDWMTDPEFMDKQNTSVIILISINDINDNTPYFPEANLPESERENRTVQEFAPKGTSVSSIVAIDLDVGDTVTYDCTPVDSNFDWIDANNATGAFTVKDSNLVDADTEKTFYFNYSCTASDDGYTHTSEPMIVPFYIIDTNNQVPTITIDETVYVDEKSDPNTEVAEVGTHDDDRDIPFHTVACNLDRTQTCSDKFIIVDNVILVRHGHDDIDRDKGDPSYSCPMTCQDNPDLLQNDRNPNSVTKTITIRLRDINDHTPEVLTEALDTSEDVEKGDIIGIIVATDIDEGDNAEIDFEVISIENSNNEDSSGLFDVTTDENYRVNLTHKQANLIASQDLRGAFGTYTVAIQVADRGDQPNVANYSITVEVEKFNFEPPRFIYPSEDGKSVLLLSAQTPFSPLILFRTEDSEYLQDFYASDSSESDICEKWDIVITFEQISPEEETIFAISNTDTCTGQLQVNNRFDADSVLGVTYNLKLIATAREGEPQSGEASYTSETNITINFLDNNQKPVFSCTSMEFKFREEKLDQTQKLDCVASYEVEDEDLPVFYYIYPESSNDVIDNTFEVDEFTGVISLKKVISFKENEQLEFKIVASNDSSPTSHNPSSFLSVTCNVIEINNNWPQWSRDKFFGAVMAGYSSSTIILTLEATDADKIDQGKLTYFLNGTVNVIGSGLNNIQEPFLVSESSGEIRLNFQVDSIMSGYFQFDVTVWDVKDQFGNGPHGNTTSVTIFIITSDNTVDFRFYNTVDEVQDQEVGMLEVISEIIGYEAYKQDILKATEDGVELTDRTLASLYFINSTTIEAIESSTILRMVSNINTFSELVVEVRNRTGLTLMSFPATATSTENLEEVLKAWLVGVSVVLGALCLILLVTFVLKTRELNNRIKKLTTNKFGSQESGLNRLGISAPTTNKHAIEGSNPIFNINSDDVKKDLSKFDEYDAHSIRSGDSDLIGIEDNPEFDYHPSAPHVPNGSHSYM
ncbi:cadherin-related tumor suppressor [Anoplophora glabripennis]|uniref:cadherin-related tumor suppressor n=1 Tax=Anoplophora glabripennis TaxID=217634 RepID=UPI00087512EA|nr:cadherin-related tumor suppressor [Anoplophora glabripennis]